MIYQHNLKDISIMISHTGYTPHGSISHLTDRYANLRHAKSSSWKKGYMTAGNRYRLRGGGGEGGGRGRSVAISTLHINPQITPSLSIKPTFFLSSFFRGLFSVFCGCGSESCGGF